MKIQIRQGVFETNSSSTHAVCIMTDDEYKQFKQGEILIDRYGDIMPKKEYEDRVKAEKQETLSKAKSTWEKYYKHGGYYKSFEDYEECLKNERTDIEFDFDSMEIEHAEREVGGVKVHAISVYGYES